MSKKLARFFPMLYNTLKFFGIKNAIYKKDTNPIDHIIDNIYLGDFRTADDINILKEYNITHIINCAFNLPNRFPNEITYKRLDLRDEPNQPIIEKLEEAYEFIKENKDKNIFIHCVFGKSRSGSVVIFYIMKEKKLNFQDAKNYVKNIRSIVEPNSGFELELNKYYEDHIANDNNKNKIDEENKNEIIIEKEEDNINEIKEV